MVSRAPTLTTVKSMEEGCGSLNSPGSLRDSTMLGGQGALILDRSVSSIQMFFLFYFILFYFIILCGRSISDITRV